ncbi:MAG: heme-binding protein [Phycisphaeraceae bacterium]
MTHRSFISVMLLLTLTLAAGGCTANQAVDLGYDAGPRQLSEAEIQQVLDQAEQAARQQPSLLRVNETGEPQHTRMHIFVVDRQGSVVGRRSMPDAWGGSVAIANAKAYTAAAFSSDQNALTTRSVGELSQPEGPLWQIGNSNANQGKPGLIEFPGGVPLYKDGQLVGAIGVSGDGVEEDENVARAGAAGFEPPAVIRIDTVTDGGVSYTQ